MPHKTNTDAVESVVNQIEILREALFGQSEDAIDAAFNDICSTIRTTIKVCTTPIPVF